MINMQVRDSYNKIALSRETAEEIWERALESAKTLPSERGGRRGKNKGKNLRRTLLIAAVIASLMTVTALASEFYGFGSLVREEREQLMAREQSDGSLESSTVTVYDIGQTRPYEGPDWAMEWVDKAQEAFGQWRSYKEEKLEAYYRDKLPNLGSFLLGEQDADYSGFQSGSFQSVANIPLGDGRRLSTYLCSTAYGEMVDGREVGGFTVREGEPMSTRSYTAADGTELTISQNGSQAIVYAYLDKSYITMTMEINSCRSPGVQETDFSLDEATVNYAADFINYKNIGK